MRLRQSLPPSQVVRSEELRFALVMNGGVSLAVWMGGASFEINRLVRETHPVYRGLLELTLTRARVDVISGTSAGGVNGAALALAQVYDRSLYSLRDVWMERGAFGHLLRDPAHANPPSLLDGDGYYLPALEQAFAALADDDGWRIAPAWVPIDLTLTATLLRGERKPTIDDLGATIEDAVHRTAFGFVRSPQLPGKPEQDAFETPTQIELLARAARTTSSFPIAFEPVFWTPDHFRNVAGVKPAVSNPRFLVDGGIVDNKPFEAALDAIFRMPGRGNIRRVLAYIAPDPSVSASLANDVAGEPPLMAEVASRSLFAIPSSQSITDQLDRIREHNRSVHRRRDAIAGLARFHTPEQLGELARQLFRVYRYRRIHGLIDLFAEWLERDCAQLPTKVVATGAAASPIGRKTLMWLRAALDEDHRWTHDRIPQQAEALERALTADAPQWEWGLYAMEFLVEFMFDVLRRVQRLRYLMPYDEGGSAAVSEWPPQFAGDWERIDDARTWVFAKGGPRRPSAPADPVLSPYWDRAFVLAGRLEVAAKEDRKRIADRWKKELVRDLIADTARVKNETELAERARYTAAEALRYSGDDDQRHEWNALATEVGQLLQDLSKAVELIGEGAHAPDRSLSLAEKEQWLDLVRLALALELDTGSPPDVVRAALRIEVIHYAMSHRERGANVAVELVQISGNSKSPLAEPQLATEKLAGMQLAHFGAFYKRSWRANDWMMGRLDGVERLLPIVLNAERLYRLYAGRPVNDVLPSRYVAQHLCNIAVEGAADDVRRRVAAAADEHALREELSFLDRQGSRIPETLPLCSELLTRRLHLEIVQAEMPLLARCARDDETAGADAQGTASQLANQVLSRAAVPGTAPSLPLDDAVALFAQKRIGTERIDDEVGSDLFTKTVTQTVAVTHAAAAGKRSGLSMTMRGFLKTLGVPILLFHWLAGRFTGGSRTSAAIGAAALAVALTMALVALLLPPAARTSVDSVLNFSWMLLGVCLLILLLRGPLAFAVMLFAIAAPLVLHYAEHPLWALAVGGAEMLLTWLVMRARGVRGLGIVVVILVIALALFAGDETRDTLKGSMCLAGEPLFARLAALDRFELLPACAPAPPIATTLPIVLAFLLFFVTVAGFVRGSPRRALARWWRRMRGSIAAGASPRARRRKRRALP